VKGEAASLYTSGNQKCISEIGVVVKVDNRWFALSRGAIAPSFKGIGRVTYIESLKRREV